MQRNASLNFKINWFVILRENSLKVHYLYIVAENSYSSDVFIEVDSLNEDYKDRGPLMSSWRSIQAVPCTRYITWLNWLTPVP